METAFLCALQHFNHRPLNASRAVFTGNIWSNYDCNKITWHRCITPVTSPPTHCQLRGGGVTTPKFWVSQSDAKEQSHEYRNR